MRSGNISQRGGKGKGNGGGGSQSRERKRRAEAKATLYSGAVFQSAAPRLPVAKKKTRPTEYIRCIALDLQTESFERDIISHTAPSSTFRTDCKRSEEEEVEKEEKTSRFSIKLERAEGENRSCFIIHQVCLEQCQGGISTTYS